MAYYTQDVDSVMKGFDVELDVGLSKKRAMRLLEQHGENKLEEAKKKSAFEIFINQFKSFIIYILLFAIVLSAIQGEYVDATVILIILLINALIGFWQEIKAEKAIDSLKELSSPKIDVLRGGKKITIPAEELVPGDIMFVSEGTKVPADARIIEASGLYISESALTGESVSVHKTSDTIKHDEPLADRKNMLFSGTLVTRGKATAIVTQTGMHTQIGKIATMINSVENKLTPLQRKLDVLGRKIGILTIIIAIVILLTGIFSEQLYVELLSNNVAGFLAGAGKWLLLAVALAVAAVPEGLPAIVTIALSRGVKRMVKRNALIRHLPSVETLGETTIICSDKTGTLTQNQMTVRKLFTFNRHYDVEGIGYTTKGMIVGDNKIGTSEETMLRIGALCNNATLTKKKKKPITGDPTEAALLVSAAKAKLDYNKLQKEFPVVHEESFDSNRKLMSTVHKDPKKRSEYAVYTKGAPERVIAKCRRILINGQVKTLTPVMRKQILKQNEVYAKHALRVLGFAYKTVIQKTRAGKKPSFGPQIEKDLIFVGLQAMIDPPRPEVKDAIATCHQAGIDVIMITGDNKITAQAIAGEIGLSGKAMEGKAFAKLSAKEQCQVVKDTRIFARVEPEHKMEIVKALQKNGHIVAMTGDGVNDAPAIKRADLGIAMGKSGTDVAKESSEMILLDDNFTSIVHAIEEGRGIYSNVRKFVNYLLSCNLGEIFIIFFAVIFFGVESLPLTAIMLLWLNLVTDGLPALALSVDPNPPDVMKHAPLKSSTGIMTKTMMSHIFFVSILITIGVLGLFKWSKWIHGDIMHMQTIAFTAIILFELIRLQTIRSEDNLGMFTNKWLILAVASSIGLQLLVIYTPLAGFFGTVPLSIFDWLVIVGVGLAVYVCNILGVRIHLNHHKRRAARRS